MDLVVDLPQSHFAYETARGAVQRFHALSETDLLVTIERMKALPPNPPSL